ncbi:MAG: RNA-directed DNA polymerase [Spirosomataceae bacterium]
MTTDNQIRKGYFPDEIPPPFNTEDLADLLPTVLPKLETYATMKSKSGNLSIPKLKSFRRNLGIPNPLHHIKLTKLIEDNWGAISTFLSGSTLTVTPIKLSLTSRRSIDEPDFVDKTHQQIVRSTASKYLLHLDISRFYASIYTHSIPWAIHSKPVAKASIRTPAFRTLYGNLLDEAIRNAQDQQTIGIPIGPDTSRIISEIIGVAIDKELKSKLPNIVGLRHIDDFYFYFKTLAELEKAKSIVQTTIKQYELELNPLKLNIAELPSVTVEPWVTPLRTFKFGTHPKSQKHELMEYFNLAFGFTEKYPDDYVLPYAIPRLQFITIDNSNFELFECLLLNSLIAEPKIVRNVLCLLLLNRNAGKLLNFVRIKETLEEFLIYHCELENTFEVSWGLWICKSLGITIDLSTANKVASIDNSVVALVALDLHHSGLFPGGVSFTLWESQMTASSLYSENWLLAYEAYIKNWLPKPTNFVEADDFFKDLFDNGVEFYDTTRQAEFKGVTIGNLAKSMAIL